MVSVNWAQRIDKATGPSSSAVVSPRERPKPEVFDDDDEEEEDDRAKHRQELRRTPPQQASVPKPKAYLPPHAVLPFFNSHSAF